MTMIMIMKLNDSSGFKTSTSFVACLITVLYIFMKIASHDTDINN